VEVADLPADSALAVLAAQREKVESVRAAVAPAAALPVPPPAAPQGFAPTEGRMVPPPPGAPPLRTEPPAHGDALIPAQPGAVHIQMPLVPMPPAPPPVEAPVETPAVAPVASAPAETATEAPSGRHEEETPVEDVLSVQEWNGHHPRRDRGLIALATLAGFVGGAVSGAGVQYLLG
jgi:hypothetical protein